ncbi:histidine phosphatase family protein [Nocardioides sp. MAH-18]|uniref:Histidine phosphatase family protein n=1 Tax=Nocardioides agri TaxID=2682843 RepID=A0A6L6XLC8_9ACTN|nr:MULTISPECIES: histidine phosphatase family protein [unclassified Nocardioides]MBA2956545.1 histidine phosphatase family protein [Nocardioides sp. CGMCC 1.13656]MVQ47692.1 histidine phosphatase family protein [Nocardioides sp. MAH-18]
MSADARRLVLLRHGRTAWNAERRIQGQLDPELDDTGHAQAAAVAPLLTALGPALLWSSDSARARQTAAYLAKESGLEPAYDARLREYYLADWQGLGHAELVEREPELFARFRTGDFDVVPGGENAVDVAARMVAVLGELLDALAPGELGVAVSHGAAIRDVIPTLLGWPVAERAALHSLDNCGWVELEQPAPGAPLRLRAYNRVAPL